MKQPFDESAESQNKRKILIIGDSHAQDFVNAIAENNYLNNSQIRTRYIPTRCQIYLGDSLNQKWLKEDLSLCKKSDNLKEAKAQITNADIVILAALWRKWAAIQLPQTIRNLNLSYEQKLFVIGRRSFIGLNEETRDKRSEVDVHQLEINQKMNDNLSTSMDKVIFIDVHKLVCGSGSSCPVFTDRSELISLDGGHLSKDGARYMGSILFRESKLAELIK